MVNLWPVADSGRTDQLLDGLQQRFETERLEEVAIATPDHPLRLGLLQEPLRGRDQDDRDIPGRGLVSQSANRSQPAISPWIRSTISNDGRAVSIWWNVSRDEVGRGDVVVLILQQVPDHIEELNRAVDDEDVLALHLLRSLPGSRRWNP